MNNLLNKFMQMDGRKGTKKDSKEMNITQSYKRSGIWGELSSSMSCKDTVNKKERRSKMLKKIW